MNSKSFVPSCEKQCVVAIPLAIVIGLELLLLLSSLVAVVASLVDEVFGSGTVYISAALLERNRMRHGGALLVDELIFGVFSSRNNDNTNVLFVRSLVGSNNGACYLRMLLLLHQLLLHHTQVVSFDELHHSKEEEEVKKHNNNNNNEWCERKTKREEKERTSEKREREGRRKVNNSRIDNN